MVGRVGRAHGVRGAVLVDVTTDDPDVRFAPGSVLHVEAPPASLDLPATVEVAATQWHSGRFLVTFSGVADRNTAELLRGCELCVDIDPAQRPQDPDEWYDHQLIGLRADLVDGTELGRVVDVLHLPGQDCLAIDTGGQELLLPFVSGFVPSVEPQNGRIVVDPPAGLVDDTHEDS